MILGLKDTVDGIYSRRQFHFFAFPRTESSQHLSIINSVIWFQFLLRIISGVFEITVNKEQVLPIYIYPFIKVKDRVDKPT